MPNSISVTPIVSEHEGGLQAVLTANRALVARFARARGVADPEDVLQELWIRLGAIPTGPIGDPLGYIMQAAHNLIVDRRRSDMQRSRREELWAEATDRDGAASQAPSAERILLALESLNRADQALRRLGNRTRHIFLRYRIDGLTRREIAEELGISVSAVEKHLQKSYRALLDLSLEASQ